MNVSGPRQEACNCSINSFKQTVYPSFYLLTFALGLLGNIASLCFFISMYRRKGSFTSVTLYMVNLLVSDLMLVCSLPFRASYYLLDFTWVFGSLACRFVSYAFYINMYTSIYFLMVLSIMRYLAVVHPYKYFRFQTNRCAWVVCLLVWAFVSLVSAPLLISGTVPDETGRMRCLELGEDLGTVLIMNHATMWVGFVLPFTVISFCYAFVVRGLVRPREVRGSRRPNNRKSCTLVIIVLALFLVCFLPYHVVRTLFLEAEQQFKRSGGSGGLCCYISRMRQAAVVVHCLAVGNSCLDPLLFFFMGDNIWNLCCMDMGKLCKRTDGKSQAANVPRTELQELKD